VVVIKGADHVKGSADDGYVDGSRLMPSTCYMGCDLSMVDSPNHSIAGTHAQLLTHGWAPGAAIKPRNPSELYH